MEKDIIFNVHPVKNQGPMEYFPQLLQNRRPRGFKSTENNSGNSTIWEKATQVFQLVKSIGATNVLDDYEKRKLAIFNQLNFLQLLTGIIVPVAALFHSPGFPPHAWITTSMPALINLLVLLLNFFQKYQAAFLTYFIFSPVLTCFIYINGMDTGIELNFILYGILSVFFLQEIGYILFAISLSMVNYFVLSVLWKDYPFRLQSVNMTAYVINQALAMIYIFFGLYLIKKENTDYQFKILSKHRLLHQKSLEIENQREEIMQKAKLLETQTAALQDMNSFKNKLFSIISHDLKSPMYALRNLFRNAHQFDMPADQLKAMLPDVVHDLNSTTELMENLLHWAKCQMQTSAVKPQKVDVSRLVHEVVKLLHLQAEAKQIHVEKKIELPVYAWADRDMVNLVIRNLLSNAIKFTPRGGKIIIGTYESNCCEVFVQDSGRGISPEEMRKINSGGFYTTKGTSAEGGTGLGLMLCREFLAKNNGHMMIETLPEQGSTFSFTLPLSEQ